MKIYKVGGAVRDKLMGVDPSDNDWVVVNSSPKEMLSQGFKPIGKDFPVFLHPETGEEYALARTEKKAGKGYHGFTFYFGKDVTLEDDLSRRDLTINAIAEDKNGEIIDPYCGQSDIQNKVFRHVTDSFNEDPLRSIRLARFHTYDHLKDFKIDKITKEKISQIVESDEIKKLSPERIWSETERALMSPNPNRYFYQIISLNLLSPFFEGLKMTECDTLNLSEIRWAELQLNNSFKVSENLPIPKKYINAVNVTRNLKMISFDISDEELIELIDKTDFIKNEELIMLLCKLPKLSNAKDFIIKIIEVMKKTDFTKLSKVPLEKIKEEKTKIYKKAINKINE